MTDNSRKCRRGRCEKTIEAFEGGRTGVGEVRTIVVGKIEQKIVMSVRKL